MESLSFCIPSICILSSFIFIPSICIPSIFIAYFFIFSILSFFEGLNLTAGAPIFISIDIISCICLIKSGLGTSGAFNVLPVPKKVDALPEPSCEVARISSFPLSGIVTIKSYVSATPINVLLCGTGTTSNPSAATSVGSSPPNVSQK